MRSLIARVFSDRDWRDHLDTELVRKLEKLLQRVTAYETAYRSAGEPKLAQLWVGLAELFYQQERMAARLRRVEHRQERILAALAETGNESGDGTAVEDSELRDSLDRY